MNKETSLGKWRAKHNKLQQISVFMTPEQRQQIEDLFRQSGEKSRQDFYIKQLTKGN